MAEALARFKPGVNVPAFAATAVLAGRFVKITGAKTTHGDYSIGHCGAGERAFGVSEADSAATTEPAHSVERRVNVVRPGAIARVKPGGAIAAAGPVKSDANGQAIAQGGSGVITGYAMDTVAGTEALVEIELV
jgi:hypothetical protein